MDAPNPNTTPALTLSLLGAPQIDRDGIRVPMAMRKAWGLLTYLAVEGRATRARLAGLLWADSDEAAARRNLRRELHRLREARLGNLIGGDEHTLRLSATECDLHRFQAALASDACETALHLYRGALLDGIDVGSEPFDAWLRHQREQLHSRWQQAARAHMQALQGTGDARGALAIALQVLDVDALQEADYRAAMTLHDRLGDREAALALYERCRRALGQELGLRPMADTVALAERIRRGEAPPADDATAAGGDTTLLPQSPLVGRDDSLARLDEWVGARGTTLAFVAITGPAGVGKTRLAREYAARHGTPRWYAAQPGDALVAYAAPARWLRERGASVSTLPAPLLRELSRVLPELGYSGPPPDPASPRDRLFDALAQGWQVLAPSSAGLEVFDDMQWLDAASVDWLLYLLTRRRTGLLPALCLARSEELPDVTAARVRDLLSSGTARTLALTHLGHDDTLSLVRRLSGSASGERFADRLHRATGGHPLFLLETLRHLLDTGWIRVDPQGQWHTPVDDQTTDYAELPVPGSVRDAILARVERLGEAPRRLLEAASCLRRPVRFELIARATALSEWESVAALERVRAAHLMVVDDAGRYRFTHDLIGQTLVDALAPERRRLLHRALARSLAQSDADPAEIARHWQEGGEDGEATPWWAKAAQQAEDLGAVEEALSHARQAVRGPRVAGQETALYLQIARLCFRRADRDGQAEALALADRSARRAGDATAIAQVQVRRAAAIGGQDREQAIALIAEVLAQPALPPLVQSAAHQQRALFERMRGDLPAAIAACDRALALLPPGQWNSRAELMHLRGHNLMFTGQREAADQQLQLAIDAARLAGDDTVWSKALCGRASLLTDRGDHAGGRALCEQALGIALPTRNISLTRAALLNLLRALVAQGDLEQARVRIDEAYALSDRFTTLGEEQALAEARVAVALMAGELGAALDATPALLDVSRRTGELYRAMSGLMAPVEPWLLLDSQRDAAAALIDEAEARTAAGRIDELSQLVAVRRAELTLWRGDAAGALARINPVLGHPALRAQDRHHALRVQALARHRIGLASTLDIPGPDMNPEPATLIHAARLMLEPTTVDAALEWFESGRATPLEALHLAQALHAVLPKSRRADHRRMANAARTLATRLHDSLAGHGGAQADFRRQFAPLF